MKIGCQNCDFIGEVNEGSITESGLSLTCPKCSKTIYINKRGYTNICHNCGFENMPGEIYCKSCKSPLKKPRSFLGDPDVYKLHRIATSEIKNKKKDSNKFIFLKKKGELNQKIKAIETFKTIFSEAISDGVLTDFEIKYLKLFAEKNEINWKEAMAFVTREANYFIESISKTYIEDGIIKDDERKNVEKISKILRIDSSRMIKIYEELDTPKRKAIEFFKTKFKEFVSDGVLTAQEMNYLKKFVNKYNLDWDDMMILVREDALSFVESLVITASEDNVIDRKEEKVINKAMDVLKLGKEEREIIKYDLLKVKAKALEIFENLFIESIDDYELDDNEMNQLMNVAEKYGLKWVEALKHIEEPAKDFIKQLLLFAKQDGIIEKEEEKTIKKMMKFLEVQGDFKREIQDEIKKIKKIQNIREGNLTPLNLKPPPVIVKSTEFFYVYNPCIYTKTDKKKTEINGKLILTSDRVFFIGKDKTKDISFKFLYKSIFNLSYNSNSVFIDRQGRGRGYYKLSKPEIIYEIFLFLIKKTNYLITQSDQELSRHIPQDVKVEVYNRDGGRCVMCGDNKYLEFDHIIPFSKGVANTVDNIQILCRACNQKKGANI